MVIGVPGFTTIPIERKASRLARVMHKLGTPRILLDAMDASTLTLRIHGRPEDYYRFSPQAVSMFLDGLLDTEICTLMLPPRIIGAGVKPTPEAS